MGKNILVVVDCQYDFINPDGALYVKGAEKIESTILKIIKDFDYVKFTADYHPIEHCSFKDNGGIWPIHCVSNSIGAGVPTSLMKAAKDFSFCFKGEYAEEEEYGAFINEDDFALLLDIVTKIDDFSDEFLCDISLNDLMQHIDNIVVCGVAGDYCVLETLKNIINYIGTEKVSVYLDGVASIDGGDKLQSYMKEKNIKEFKLCV